METHITDRSPALDTGAETDRAPTARYPGIPRWVKASGIVVLALGLLFGISHFTGLMPGMHGAGAHGGGQHTTMHMP
jgi:hypothetical protein